MRTEKEIGSFVLIIICIALVLGAVAFFVRNTNGFTDDFKSFYLTYNGQKITQTNSTLSFEAGETVKIGCTYTLDKLGASGIEKGYTVSITPNATETTDFEFAAGSSVYSFATLGDITDCFRITKYTDYFTFEVKDMQTILERKYPRSPVVLPNTANEERDFFKMTVTSSSGKIVYNIIFSIGKPQSEVTA